MDIKFVGTFFFILFIPPLRSQECSRYVSFSDKVIHFSNDRASAKSAQATCQAKGGQLALFGDRQSIDHVSEAATSLYAKDLQIIWMYEQKNRPNNFKYSITKIEQSSTWKPVMYKKSPFYFHLHKSESASSSTPVYFCHPIKQPDTRWLVQPGKPCNESRGWKNSFWLYASSGAGPGIKPLQRYAITGDIGTKLWPLKEKSTYTIAKNPLYVFDVNIWAGSTKCTPSTLHYVETWMSSCNTEVNATAFYACQFTLNATAMYNCQGLVVSWSENLSQLTNLQNKDGITVEVQVLQTKIKTSRSYNDKSYVISDKLAKNANLVKLTAKLSACTSIVASTTIQVSPLPRGQSQRVAYIIKEQTVNVTKSDCVMTTSGDVSAKEGFCKIQVNVEDQSVQAFSVSQGQKRFRFQLEKSKVGTAVNFSVLAYGAFPAFPKQTATIACHASTANKVTRSNSGSLAGALVAVVVILIIVIALAVFYYKKRRRKNKLPKLSIYRPNGNNRTSSIFRIEENPNENVINIIEIPPVNIQQQQKQRNQTDGFSAAIPTTNVEDKSIKDKQLLQAYIDNSVDGFKTWKLQYEEVCRVSKAGARTYNVAKMPFNKKKNRYKDIYPYDDSRVVLSGDEAHNYINASYISGYRHERKFIAAQGPKPETLEDFWKMIWENGTTLVVMLTNLVESGKSKCAKYWPERTETFQFGEFDVETNNEFYIGGIIRRELSLFNDNMQRTIHQLHFTSWPDHGIPEVTSNMMYLRHMVEELNDGKPIVVHCSAGAGRTGTYIAMDVLINEMSETNQVNVMRATMKMREHRSDMIQTLKQYVFVHRLLVEHYYTPNSDRTLAEFDQFAASQWSSVIKDEYDRLELLQLIHRPSPDLNLYETCQDVSLVTVVNPTTNEEVGVNSNYIEDRSFSRVFIASQGPDYDPELFWTMVIQCNALTVFELEEPSKAEKVSSLLENDRVIFGDVSIDVMSIHYREGYMLQELYIQLASGLAQPVIVTHICGLKWDEDHNPPQPATLVAAIDSIDIFMSENPARRPKLLVHCRNGCTRSGMLIVLINCIERLTSQQRVDIFRAVEDLRSLKSNMVNSQIMYKYIYEVMKFYSSICNSEYSNLR